MSNVTKDKLGVIIVDHGSRRDEANRMLDEMVALYRERSGVGIVEAAHMELASPTIAEAVSRCVEQGATRLVVVLFFLSPGRHSREDIPDKVREAVAGFPGVDWCVTEPLGVAEELAGLMMRRMEEAVDG